MKFSLHHLLAAIAIFAIYFQVLQVLADRFEITRLEFLVRQEYDRAVKAEKNFAPNARLNTFRTRVLTSYRPPVDYQVIKERHESQVKREAAP